MSKLLGGSAGTLLGLAAGVYLSANPSWVGHHTRLAMTLYFVSFLSLLFTLFQFNLNGSKDLWGFNP